MSGNPGVFIALALSATACSGLSEPLLVGGEAVPEERYYPATLFFGLETPAGVLTQYLCTGVKVTARQFVTAAHCVYDQESHRHRVNPGYRIRLTTANDLTQQEWGTDAWSYWVEAVHVHSEYKERESASDDIAVVTLAADLADVPRATLAREEPAPGTQVVKVGYGCEHGFNVDPQYPVRLKFAFDTLLGPTDFQQAYSDADEPLPDRDTIARFRERGVFTHAILGKGSAGLCFGDSGGPLYLANGGGLEFVGINAQSWNQHGANAVVDYHVSVVRMKDWLAAILHH